MGLYMTARNGPSGLNRRNTAGICVWEDEWNYGFI